jgi:hypothetical protein
MQRKTWVLVGGFVLGAVLLVLALRGVDFARVSADLANAQWGWLVPLGATALGSHWLRAWRWTLLLDTLPRGTATPGVPVSGASGVPVSAASGVPVSSGSGVPVGGAAGVPVSGAFGALMVGYMANYAAPRLGEVVRTANLSARFGLRFSGVLGTVAVERLLDVVTLGLALLTIPFFLAGRLDSMRGLWTETIDSWAGRIEGHGLLLAGLAVAGLAVLAGVVIWIRRGRHERLRHIGRSFADGLAALARTPHRGVLLLTTVGIWLLYAVMAWVPFRMFGFDTVYGITFGYAWAIMLIGALGVVVPSPGGIGSYHFITIQALVLMFGFSTSEAASYAIVSHAGQLVLYVVVGFMVMIYEGFRWSDLVKETPDA